MRRQTYVSGFADCLSIKASQFQIPMNSKKEPSTLLDLLPLLSGGRVTVTAGGYPFVSIRSDEKEIDIDVSGAKMAGVSLSDVIKLEEGGESILTASERAAKKLSNLRWRLTLYDT